MSKYLLRHVLTAFVVPALLAGTATTHAAQNAADGSATRTAAIDPVILPGTAPPSPAHTEALGAHVLHKAGQVQLISRTNNHMAPLANGSPILAGDEILVGSGTATVRLANGAELRLFPGSRLAFGRMTDTSAVRTPMTRVRLKQGKLHASARPPYRNGGSLTIETASAIATSEKATYTIETKSQRTRVQVTDGFVDFGSPGKAQRVPSGYGARVTENGLSGLTIRELPAAPEVTSMPATISRLPLQVSWAEDGAATHRLDIFEAFSGRWIGSREIRGNSFDIGMLDNGRYEIQLVSIDHQGTEGMPTVVPVEVRLRAQTATLFSPDAGATANDDMPEFRWQLNGNNELARVEIARDKSFQSLIATSEWAPESQALPSRPLPPGQYYWRVVTEAGGNSTVATKARKLVIQSRPIAIRDSERKLSGQKVTALPGSGGRG